MTPIGLAAQALAILTPLLIKGGEALAQGIGKDIWEGIKGLFRKSNHSEVLEKLEQNPKDEETKEEVKFHLATILTANGAPKEQLEKMVTTYNTQQQQTTNQTVSSDLNITAGRDISGNTITYHKD